MKRWALKTLLIASILTLGVVKTSFATVYYNNYGVSSFINGHYIAGSGSPWLSLNASTTPFQVSATTTGNIYIFYNGGTTPSSGGPLGSIASSTGIACSFYITPSFESPIATSSLCYGNNLYPNIDYYLRVATNSTFVDQYTTFAVNSFGLSISISDISNFIPYFSTHIISVIPASNTTIIPFVSTSTQRFADFDIDELDFYNNTLSATDTIAIINTQLVNNNIASYQYTKSLTESFLGGLSTTTYNVAKDVPFGNYNLSIYFLNNNLQVITSTTSTNITFGSSTNAITFTDIYGASSSNPFDISQIATSSTCGITDLTGCFKNALVWAFFPNMDLIKTEITNLRGSIQNKPPFGYFTMLQTNMNNLNASGTAMFTIIIPYTIKTTIFDPLKTALTTILWFVGSVWLYNRMKHIQL